MPRVVESGVQPGNGRHLVGEGPADSSGESEGHADHQHGQRDAAPQRRRPGDRPGRPTDAHWPAPVMPRTAVALAEALTVNEWSPAIPRIWVGWVASTLHGDGVSGDRDLAGVAGAGQIPLGRLGGLGRIEHDGAGLPVGGEVDLFGAGPGRRLGLVGGPDLGRKRQPAVDDQPGAQDEGRRHHRHEGGHLPVVIRPARGAGATGRGAGRGLGS